MIQPFIQEAAALWRQGAGGADFDCETYSDYCFEESEYRRKQTIFMLCEWLKDQYYADLYHNAGPSGGFCSKCGHYNETKEQKAIREERQSA